MTKDHDDKQPKSTKGVDDNEYDSPTLEEMNLLRGMIQTGKLTVDPPSGLAEVMKGLDDD
jgi:hypothetical protein